MFAWGLCIGLVIGMGIGIVVVSMCFMARED